MITSNDTTNFTFAVNVQVVGAADYAAALDHLTEALQECEESVIFSISTGGMPVAFHSDFSLPHAPLFVERDGMDILREQQEAEQ